LVAGLDDLPDDLLEIGDARGPRQRTAPPQVEVIRSLGADDLHLLTAPLSEPLPAKPLSKLKHSHHEAARLMAIGTPDVEISLYTGYNNTYLSTLRSSDPAFQELLSHYADHQEQKHVDVVERMRQLGLDSLEVLQDRLNSDENGWSRRELMELADLMLLKPIQATRSVGAGGSGPVSPVQIAVNFVTAPDSTKVIEHQPSEPNK
jgi:hypothetical protein